MGGVQQIFPGVGINRDAPGRQCLGIGRGNRRGPPAGCSSPHTGPGGSRFPPAPAPPAATSCSIFFRDEIRVCLRRVVGQEVRFHTARVRSRCPADQPLAVAVSGIAQRGSHELLKQKLMPAPPAARSGSWHPAPIARSGGVPSSGRGGATPPGSRGQRSSFCRKMLGSA